MTRSRIVFAGTPQFSVPCLEALYQLDVDLLAVYCQPDRPAGRGRTMRPCAVKQRAGELGIPVRQPTSLGSGGQADALADLRPDLMVVVAYGLILPPRILSTPTAGCINVHASLLPRWRGAAPIQRAIEAGDTTTGVTLMRMDNGLDTGPMLDRVRTAILDEDTGATLHDRLSTLGAALLTRNLDAVLHGGLPGVAQDDKDATYARKIDTGEGEMRFTESALDLERRIRAFNPWPVCRTSLGGQRVRVFKARVMPLGGVSERPGTILQVGQGGIDVACSPGILRLLELQKSGGKRLPVADFLNGTRVDAGSVLGEHEPVTG
jgi:methionyl-tRNA formyltransferase